MCVPAGLQGLAKMMQASKFSLLFDTFKYHMRLFKSQQLEIASWSW